MKNLTCVWRNIYNTARATHSRYYKHFAKHTCNFSLILLEPCNFLYKCIVPSTETKAISNYIHSRCLWTELPYYNIQDYSFSLEARQHSSIESNTLDLNEHLNHMLSLTTRPKHLKLMHLNAQSMVSTFNELVLTMKQYPFDVICMSETWLKDNPLLLQHVNIPGYSSEFRNCNSIKGGGVGAYINEMIKYCQRRDIEEKEPSLEHLWLEFPGRNKHSKLLVGTIYRVGKMLKCTEWLERFENLLGYLISSWDGLILVTGDINIDLHRSSNSVTIQVSIYSHPWTSISMFKNQPEQHTNPQHL